VRINLSRRTALSLSLAVATAPAFAQGDFPSRTVTVIVPFPPGGATDLIARPFGAALQRQLGQSVALVNRGGAGGAVGMNAGALSRADGYTGVIAHVSYSSIPPADALFGRPPSFDPATLAPIALLTADPLVIVVKADAPWRTWLDFAGDARANPGRIAYGSSGPYSAVHIPFEMLAQAGGFQLNHVPYSGGGPALAGVLGGHVAATASTPAVVAPYIRQGQMRALVNTGARRVALLPDVPTGIELGFAGVEFYLWVGFFTQAATDPAIQARLREAVAATTRDQEMLRQLQTSGLVLDHREGQAFTDFLEADRRRVTAVVNRIGRVE
jgi:tripartite-type tricarboxylate transporter receptor subunit TctC